MLKPGSRQEGGAGRVAEEQLDGNKQLLLFNDSGDTERVLANCPIPQKWKSTQPGN